MGRHERRIQLKRSVEAVSRGGMDLAAPGNEQSWSVIAATRILLDILETRSPSRASAAAKRVMEFFETSLKNNPSKFPIACAKGCAFCCHVSVTATAPEIFLVANAVRERHKDNLAAGIAHVRAADQRTRGLTSQLRGRLKIPCAMLEDNACTVYAARPGACRGFTSTSAKSCERGYNGENVQIDTPMVWTALRSAQKQALWAALDAAKLPSTLYEFHHGLLVALETPDAEARWLKGEDIFAGVARETMVDPAANASNQRIIAQLIAGAEGREMP